MYKEDVLNYHGTLVKLAEVLKISPSAISQWKEIIPERQAYRLQHISNNALIVNTELYKR